MAVHVVPQSVPPKPTLHKVATFDAEQVKIFIPVQLEHELPSVAIKLFDKHLVTAVAVHVSALAGHDPHVLSDFK